MGTKATEWNLVSAGPSRQHLRASHFLDGPVVTVNRAIDIAGRGLRVDFAAISDGPGGCWEPMNLERYWSPGMILWVTTRLLRRKPVGTNAKVEPQDGIPTHIPMCNLWDFKLSASIGIRFMPDVTVPDVDYPNDPARARYGFTTIQAFAGIMRFRPKKVRILSMDMSGPWIPGKTEEECDEHDKRVRGLSRWRHERKAMRDAIAIARQIGTQVEELIPSPLSTEGVTA